jgi:hypothetical protein
MNSFSNPFISTSSISNNTTQTLVAATRKTTTTTRTTKARATEHRRKKKEKRRLGSVLAETFLFPRLFRVAKEDQVNRDLREIAANVIRNHQKLPFPCPRELQSKRPSYKSRRVESNPFMFFEEGDKVVVTSSDMTQYKGIITSILKDQIYLLTNTRDAHFETISFQKWLHGEIQIEKDIW